MNHPWQQPARPLTFTSKETGNEGIVLFVRPLDDGFEIISHRGAHLKSRDITLRFASSDGV